MKLTSRFWGAVGALILALVVSLHALTTFFMSDPIRTTFAADAHQLTFAADADRYLTRCTRVQWDVSPNQGVWVNGLPRESTGSAELCIGEFTRPQIYVIFDDETAIFQELAVSSVLYTPHVTLGLTAHGVIIVLLLVLSAHLSGLTLPRAGITQLRTTSRRLSDSIPNRALIAAMALLVILYALVSLALMARMEIVYAVEEDYLNDRSIRAVWDSGQRPITLPLFFKLLDNNGDRIELFQWIVAIASWSTFAGSVAFILRNRLLKIAAFTLILLFSLTRDVAYWSSMLYSESLSNSLGVLLVAAALIAAWAYRHHADGITVRAQLRAIVLVVPLAFLWSYTRDTNAYSGLAVGMLLLGFAALLGWRHWRGVRTGSTPLPRAAWLPRLALLPLIVGIALVAIFALQNHQANKGLRYRLSLVNVLAKRILVDPEKTAYFAERGMPTTEAVMRYAGHDKFAWSYGLDFSGFEGWLESDGKRVYTDYLLSRPVESVKEALWDNWHRLWVFESDIIHDWGAEVTVPGWQETLTDLFYTETWGLLLLTALGGLTALLVSAYTGYDYRLSVPIVLAVLVFPAAFLNWHGDSNAVERHALRIALQWRLAMWLFLFVGLDRVLSRETALE